VVLLKTERVAIGDEAAITYVELAQSIRQTFRIVRMLLDSDAGAGARG
jgi:hypothetical protein